MKIKKVKWRKLDNSAKIFPIISNKKISTVFRISAILKEKIEHDVLQKAVEVTLDKQVAFKVKLRRGFFWYYFEQNSKNPLIEMENNYPCKYIDRNENNGYLFKVTYYNKKINLDILHSLTDGNGAVGFLKEIVYNYIDIKKDKENNKNSTKIRVIQNNTEDSYLKNYDKRKAKREHSKKAYVLQGKKLPLYATGVIHEIINLEQLKEVAKR